MKFIRRLRRIAESTYSSLPLDTPHENASPKTTIKSPSTQITRSNIPTATKLVIDTVSSMAVDTLNTQVTSTVQPSVVKKTITSKGNISDFVCTSMISLSV